MTSLVEQRILAARAGTNPTVIAGLPSGWAVMGDSQFLPGTVLLLADPVVSAVCARAGRPANRPGVERSPGRTAETVPFDPTRHGELRQSLVQALTSARRDSHFEP